MPAARQTPTQGTQGLAHNSGYASAAPTEQASSAQNYNYNQYQSGNTQDSTSSDRVAYQPYSNNPPGAQSSSYSSSDNYNARVPNAASSTLSGSLSQNVASSYHSNPAATTNNAQWGTSTPTPQARNTRGYNNTQSATSSAYNSSHTPQSQSLQGFSVRPQPQTQPRSSSTTYSQQLQQQQQRQQQQHGQQQQQQGYSGYMNQQQQQQPTTSSQQNWGYGFGAANSSSSGYNSAAATGSGNNAAYPAAGATSHGTQGHGHAGHGHQAQQQHRSMNLSSHTYMEHDQALYALLRSNPAG
ncbi:hypothetical protein NEMBOFW57_007433 [Staphylotrichum longicolle]|uniref:Uncharacterized protein n=1 Tax=Staphylotrichum longicolle TaxID=669026 RepID=A0AAD4EVH4_9PEZI|nr:hypothetical protein NEMBOFW57_007433 [Staphylotrichum longicolle]